MTSKPSTFGSFRSKRTTLRYKICVPTRAFPHTKKILKSFSAIVRNNDFIPDIVLLQGPRRECFVVRVVFNQQNRLIFHDPLHEWIPSQSKIKTPRPSRPLLPPISPHHVCICYEVGYRDSEARPVQMRTPERLQFFRQQKLAQLWARLPMVRATCLRSDL